MTRIKRIPILQAAKVCGLTGFMLGGLSSCLGADIDLLHLDRVAGSDPHGSDQPASGGGAARLRGHGCGLLGVQLSSRVVGRPMARPGGGGSCSLRQSRGKRDQLAVIGQGESVDVVEPTSEEPEGRSLDGKDQLEQQPIRVYRMKLGPTGTDRSQHGSSSHGKTAEWFDVRNDGSASVRTSGLCLYHLEYPSSEGEPEYRFVATLPECSLKPGEILRVHSGPRRDLAALYSEDRTGADQHAFTGGEARVWNRREGDTAVLYAQATKETTDSVSYDPNPPEGVVLWREGHKLVPTPVGAGTGRR